jgi:hypothetical protein
MMLEMANASAELAPYWASLPKKEESFGIYSFPLEYVEMLQSFGQVRCKTARHLYPAFAADEASTQGWRLVL